MAHTIRTLTREDKLWVRQFLRRRWGSAQIVSRGRIYQADELPGFIAEHKGEPVGLLTYHLAEEAIEIITLDSLRGGSGVGSALLGSVEDLARREGCQRLWLITTNDNQGAIAFYRKRGFRLKAIRRGAVAEARKLKAEIPTHGENGVPIEDEWELERIL